MQIGWTPTPNQKYKDQIGDRHSHPRAHNINNAGSGDSTPRKRPSPHCKSQSGKSRSTWTTKHLKLSFSPWMTKRCRRRKRSTSSSRPFSPHHHLRTCLTSQKPYIHKRFPFNHLSPFNKFEMLSIRQHQIKCQGLMAL